MTFFGFVGKVFLAGVDRRFSFLDMIERKDTESSRTTITHQIGLI
jgi:hypothetical protein